MRDDTPKERRCPPDPLFESPFLGGFECSCHCLEDGTRLDLQASTGHARFGALDYARLREVGIRGCRDGISWVRAEREAGRYDFAAVTSLVRAAEAEGVQVIWDLMHFGWPGHIDVFSPAFPGRFGRYARAFARWFANESDRTPMVAPINETSFLAWAGGDVRCMNPFEAARGVELKAQLVRATIEAIEAIRGVDPRARFLQPEPLIAIHPDPTKPKTFRRVESDNLLQYQAWDMLTGRVWPALGGRPEYLDILGVNYYSDNQFMLDGTTVGTDEERYVPLSRLLLDAYARYRRPMIVSETGSEGDARVPWLRYVCDESVRAIAEGCDLHAVTLYPIVNHPGWVDGRHCHNGLWDYCDDEGQRPIHAPLAQELEVQAERLRQARALRSIPS